MGPLLGKGHARRLAAEKHAFGGVPMHVALRIAADGNVSDLRYRLFRLCTWKQSSRSDGMFLADAAIHDRCFVSDCRSEVPDVSSVCHDKLGWWIFLRGGGLSCQKGF